MSDGDILKSSENIKLTKTDLEVINKHVSFFPPDLLYKERESNKKKSILTNKPVIRPIISNHSNTNNNIQPLHPTKNKPSIQPNMMRMGFRGMNLRFT